MAKPKFTKDIYKQMIEEALGGTTAYEGMKAKKSELSALAQGLSKAIGKIKDLSSSNR